MKHRLLFLRSQQKLFEVQTRLYLVTLEEEEEKKHCQPRRNKDVFDAFGE